MSTAVIADSHLGGYLHLEGAEHNLRHFLEQLEELPEKGVDRLILLGDIFQVWVAQPKFETPEVRAVLPALRRLREAGMRIDYVIGNRDHFLLESPYVTVFSSVGYDTEVEIDGRRYLLTHGHRMKEGGPGFGERLLAGPIVRFILWFISTFLPFTANWATGRADWLLQVFKKRGDIPFHWIQEFAQRKIQQGYDGVIVGHFHKGLECRNLESLGTLREPSEIGPEDQPADWSSAKEPKKLPLEGIQALVLEAWFLSRKVRILR
ncbi:MAG: metallophosphoesterase family protein [Acidobacteriota bacterium]